MTSPLSPAVGTDPPAEGAEPDAPSERDVPLRHRHARRTPSGGRIEAWITAAALAVLVAGSLAAHDVHRMLTQPLWRDENWVAVTLRAPAAEVLRLTSTTPVLFTALLRVTPHTSPSGLRILPLVFTVACVIPAWYLGRELDRRSWVTRVVLAAGVAFAPSLLIRHDLKQYSAEALSSLVVLWLLARLEARWSRRRLVVLCVVLAASTLLSNASMYLGPAVLVALGAVLAVRKDAGRLKEWGVAAATTLFVDLVVLLVIDRPGDTPTLRTYWTSFYIPTSDGLATALRFVHLRAAIEFQSVGLGPSLAVAGLVVAGLVTLARTGFWATALVVPVAAVEQLAMAGAHRYPLWDPRTSTWFSVLLTVLALVGVTGLARASWHLLRQTRHPAGVLLGMAAGLAVLLVVVGLAGPYRDAARTAMATTTPLEDVQGQVRTIAAQARPGDVVLANVDAGFGMGVYWPAQPQFVFRQARLDTFRIAYLPSDRVVVAATLSAPAEAASVREAVALAAPRHGRIWVVFSHVHGPELVTFTGTMLGYGRLSLPPGQHGLEPVRLLTPGG